MVFWRKSKKEKVKKVKKEKQTSHKITESELRTLVESYTVSDKDRANITQITDGPISFIEDTEVISEEGVKKYRTESIKKLFNKLKSSVEVGSVKEKLIVDHAKNYSIDCKNIKESFKKSKLNDSEKEVEVLLWLNLKYFEKDLITFDTVIQVYNSLRLKTTTESKIPALLYRTYKTFEAMSVDQVFFLTAIRKGLMMSYDTTNSESEKAVALIGTILNILNSEYEFDIDTWNNLRTLISGELELEELLNLDSEEVEETAISEEIKLAEELEIAIEDDTNNTLKIASDFEVILKMSESMRKETRSSEFEMLIIKLIESHEKISGNPKLKIHLANGNGLSVTIDKNSIKEGLKQIIEAPYCNFKFCNTLSCLQVQTEINPEMIYLVVYDTIIDKLRSSIMINDLLSSNSDLVFRFLQMKDDDSFEGLCSLSEYLNTDFNGVLNTELLNNSLKFSAMLGKLLE